MVVATLSSHTAFVDLNLQNTDETLGQCLVKHYFCCVPKNDVLRFSWKHLSPVL